MLLELAGWLHERTGEPALTLAGGVALNCVANSGLYEDGPFDDVWVQPAAGDAGTALGAALARGPRPGRPRPAHGHRGPRSSLGGRPTSSATCATPKVRHRPARDIAEAVADVLAGDGIVAWFQGRSEFGPRALGHRSLLAHPGRAENLERLNDVKGREQFRPVAPMVLARTGRRDLRRAVRSPARTCSSPTGCATAGASASRPWSTSTARLGSRPSTATRSRSCTDASRAFERRTGLPVVVNTSLNTAGRPMVDDPRDALECFGSAPVDALAMGPFLGADAGT